ncbi:hypothetical protein DY000_02015170 [Brassica cretica]|uniref:Uncharacterized protein n=1 Tax=Brassica cretica TaxID=69181 RepID=A0ABQ7CSW3_BRACR|nr:hypothetical protein DY000_02015170 [Brassica cretica]
MDVRSLHIDRALVRTRSLRSDRAEHVFGHCVTILFKLLSDDSRFLRKAFRKEESISKKMRTDRRKTFDRELVRNTFRCLLVMCMSCATCMLASFKLSRECHKLHVCFLDKSIMCKSQAICSSCLQLSSYEGNESSWAVESDEAGLHLSTPFLALF